MKESLNFDVELLKEEAYQRVLILENRTKFQFPAHIQAVLVLGGPGTYIDRLKPQEDEWMRWMNRDRVRAGVAVVREITRSAKSHRRRKQIKLQEISLNDILELGPYFVYNGAPAENESLRLALSSPFNRLPQKKVIIIDEILEENQSLRPIHHTHDQIKSFYQEVAKWQSLLHHVQNIALVSHSPHFIRIPHYIRHFEQIFLEQNRRILSWWAYGVKSRPGVFEKFAADELEKLVEYAKLGYLSATPTVHLTIA